LLNKYKITPAPHVVELDEHPLGEKLQLELSHTTGRRTVPNILINGRSIGGGDELEELHDSGKLEDTVRNMGGKRVQISKAASSRVKRAS
jgi:glutaredoxin